MLCRNKYKIGFTAFLILSFVFRVDAQVSVDSLKIELMNYHTGQVEYLDICKEIIPAIKRTDKAYVIEEIADSALVSAQKQRDTSALVMIYSELGDRLWMTGDLTGAADKFNEIRIISELTGNNDWKALSYNGLGITYYLMYDYDNALSYYSQAKDFIEKDTVLLMRLYNNLAGVYTMTGALDSVFEYYHAVRKFDEEAGDLSRASNSYLNLALAYARVDSVDQSTLYASLAVEAAKESGDPRQEASVLNGIASMVYNEHPDRSISLSREAYQAAEKAGANDQMISADERLTYLFNDKEMYDSSLNHLYRAYMLKDSLNQQDQMANVQEVEVGFQWAMDRIAAEKAENEQAIKAANVKARNGMIMFILLFILAALIAISVILYRSNSSKKRLNEALAASNRTKDRFFSLIAHDLRSPLSGAIGLSEVIKDEIADLAPNNNLRKYALTLHNSLNEIRSLTENLLQWAQNETGRIPFHPKKQLLYPIAEESVLLLSDLASSKNIRIVNTLPKDLHLTIDANMMNTVFRNVISNSLKYTPKGGEVTISAVQYDTQVIIQISDSGVGIDQEVIEKILNPEETFTTLGTGNEKGTGLGLSLCHEFVIRHNGQLRIDSEPGEGTTVRLIFPLEAAS